MIARPDCLKFINVVSAAVVLSAPRFCGCEAPTMQQYPWYCFLLVLLACHGTCSSIMKAIYLCKNLLEFQRKLHAWVYCVCLVEPHQLVVCSPCCTM
jgi:hypothetical protein